MADEPTTPTPDLATRSRRAAVVLILLNALLLVAKTIVGWRYDSLAILSDAGNSLTDVVTSVIILVAVRESAKPADREHPFGHARIEPMAAFTVAVLTCMLATEVAREAVGRVYEGSLPQSGWVPVMMLVAVIAVKGGIWRVAGRMGRQGSAALKAAAVDARMDVVISLMALGSLAGESLRLNWLDGAASLLIAVWIAWTGYQLGAENVERLIGHLPDSDTLKGIHDRLTAMRDAGRILDFHELRIQYIGTEIHLAVHVTVDGHLDVLHGHAIDEAIQHALHEVPGVTFVAVHVEPG
ncbi:Manganese efflux system protein MneS [Candidatus Magnetaquicoccaceae bacterium FCR-1]|uniref:Manganese efflux system protein MneS n=1 Tax=Candidatus Magnetaquiglobus chichijimensis TaxID=3141448 RepID=A0ABQ0CCV3_9PROT